MSNIFPTPEKYTEKDGTFTLGEKVYMLIPENFSNKEFITLAKELWHNFTANKSTLEIRRSPNLRTGAYISNSMQAILQNGKTDYEYEINCGEYGISITFSQENGLIHAFSTVLQMLPPYSLSKNNFQMKCFEIKDKPSLEMRCMHLCVFPETTLLFLKKMIRLFGLLKCSHIILEFWGMLKFDCFPYLGWQDAYTKEDLLPLISDGKALGVEFIPMFNHMGHASGSSFKAGKHVTLDQAPEYEEYFSPDGWTWNINNPDVLELQDKIRYELCEIFGEGKYFHIGCDEVYAADCLCNPYDKEDNENFISYINNTASGIAAMGRIPIMWGDMFLDIKDFPYPFCSNLAYRCCDGKNNLSKLAENVIIADWQYNIDGENTKSVDFFLDVIPRDRLLLCPWEGKDNVKGRCDIARREGLYGVIGTTWSGICREPKFAVYTACLMWENTENQTPFERWEVFKVMTAKNIRKLVPCGGIYKNAGFTEKELFEAIL